MTPPLPALPHAETFRQSVPIRVGAYYVLFASCALFSWSGFYPFPVRSILAVTIAETVCLALLYRMASSSRAWAATYLAIEATCQTVIFHFSGDLRIAIAPTVYTFELLNPGLRMDRRGHFLVANGFVVLFAGIVVGEHFGLLPQYSSPALAVEPALRLASVIIVALCLTVAAYFISAARDQLESRSLELWHAKQSLQVHSDALEQRVVERAAALERSYEALREKSRELRAFIYTVTHELKNPFNSILLTAKLLLRRDRASLSPESCDDLELIARTAGHGENMLRDLLGLFQVTSRHEAPALIDLGPVVSEVLELLRPQIADREIRVHVGALPRVWGQPDKLRHVVGNLLSNAVRYAPRASGEVTIRGHQDNGLVTLEVGDNGIGIPDAYHRRIFELFGRVPPGGQDNGDQSSGGTGVGLALVRRIVEEHGGTIWVESTPGAGSRFFARLPAAPTDGS